MKTFKLFSLLVSVLILISCSSDNDSITPRATIEAQNISNLFAPQEGGQGQPTSGAFTKFDVDTGAITDSETEWDLAFRGTTIAVNGGVETGTIDEPVRTSDVEIAIVDGIFEEVLEVPASATFNQDNPNSFAIPTGSGNGWYNYNPTTNILRPIPGKVFIIKTSENRYAKIEFLNYYQDAPSNIDPTIHEPRYYTFRYIYNPNENDTSFD